MDTNQTAIDIIRLRLTDASDTISQILKLCIAAGDDINIINQQVAKLVLSPSYAPAPPLIPSDPITAMQQLIDELKGEADEDLS